MKRITQLLFIIVFIFFGYINVYAQLDSEHYLPPLKQAVNNQSIRQQEIYLSTPETTAFNVDVYQGTNPVPIGTITGLVNGTPQLFTSTIPLPNGDNNITLVDNSNTGIVLSNSGLRFVAAGGEKFYVNYRGRSGAQAGSLTAKGRKALGTNFRWGGIPNRANNANLTTSLGIMATVDNTTVNVFGYDANCEFRIGANPGGNTADAFSITLNAGQSYVIEAPKNQTTANVDGWLGASITSDKPIAISNGGLNFGIRVGSESRDIGMDQPVPVTSIGREYVFIRGNGNNQTEFPVIVGTQNGTDVSVGGVYFTTINNGDYVEIPSTNYSSTAAGANMYVTTSKDAYAFQCLAGQSGIQTVGMNFIPPVNCLLPSILDEISFIDVIAGASTNESAITIVASTTTPDGNISVTDGSGPITLPASIPVAGTPDWKSFFVTGLIGNVSVTSTGAIAVGTFGSLGTNAGFAGYFSGFDTVPTVEVDLAGSNCFPGTTIEEITGGFDSYQWYVDGTLIPGATSSTYTPTGAGGYYVQVNKAGCLYNSAVFPIYYCNPEIVVNKTDNVDPIFEGDNVTFTITVESLGINPITNLVVTDALPAGFSTVSVTPSYGTWSTPNWTIGTMNAGEVHTLTIVAQATVGTEGTTLTNTVSHTQDQTDSNTVPDDLTEDVTVVDGEIRLTKDDTLIDGGDGLQAGDIITYDFVITNNGALDLSSITLTDPILPGSPISITGAAGDTNTDNILNVGETWTYSVNYTITQADMDAGNVTNSATISGTQPNGTVQTDLSDDPNDATDVDDNGDGDPDDDTVTTLPESPSIALTKVGVINDGGDGLQAGDTIDYTFVVSNTGNVSLLNVVVNDPLLGGVVAGPASGDTDTDNELDVTETWTYTASYTITQSDIDNGGVTNAATVVADSPGGTGASDNSDDPNDATDVDDNGDGDPDDDTVTTLPESPSIALTKVGVINDGGDGLQAGDTIDYTFVVSNTGNVSLLNVVVNDPLLGGVVAGPASGDTDTDNELDVTETWTYTASYTITQSDIDNGGVTNAATVVADSPGGTGASDNSDDPNDATDVDDNGDGDPDDDTVTTLPESPSIALTKVGVINDGGDGLQAGDTIDYTFVVSNTGNVSLLNVVVNDPLLGGVVAGPASGDTDTDNELDVTETWTYTASYTITQSDIDNGGVTNAATVVADSPGGTGTSDNSDDPNDATDVDDNGDGDPDDDTVTTLPESPSIALTKVGVINDGGDGLQAGDTIDYTFVVSNTGNVSLLNVVVNDPLLGGVVAGPASGDTDTDNELDVTETWTYTASYTITQSDIDNGGVTNAATVVADSPGGTGASDNSDDPNDATDVDDNGDGDPDDDTVTTLPESPSIALTKVGVINDGGDGLQAGDTIDYTFVVTNTGNVSLSNVVVNDPLLGGVVAGPASGDTDTDNELDVTETWTYTASYTITQSDIDNGGVTNAATVVADSPGGTGASDNSDDPNDATDVDDNGDGDPDDDTVTTLPESPSIALTKVGVINDGGDGLQAGDTIDYTFTVTNTGNVSLSNVVVNDPLLGGVVAGPASGDTDTDTELDVTETWTYTASYTITQADIDNGGVTNAATVVADSPGGTGASDNSDDPNDATDVDDNGDGDPDDDTVTTLPESPSMALTKVGVINDGGDGLQAGDTIDYTFVVTNTGNVSLSNVVVNDPLLGGVVAGPASGDTDTDTELDVTETWTYTASYTITQADIDAGGVTNAATVVADSPGGTGASDNSDDPNDATDVDDNGDGDPDDDTVTTLPESPSMALTKVGVINDGGDGLQAGDTIDYTFTVTNTGNVSLSNVVVNDPLLGGVVAGPASGDTDTDTELDVTETWTYTASYTITQADIDNGGVTNAATVVADSPGGTGASDNSDDPNDATDVDDNGDGDPDDDTVTTLPESPSMALTKVGVINDGGDGLQAGDTIDYTFVVTNTGNVSLSNVVVNDPLLGGVVAGPASGDTDTDTELDVTETWTYTASYTITQADIDAGGVTNAATVVADSPGGTGATDNSDDPNDATDVDDNGDGDPDDDTFTEIIMNPELSVIKIANFNDENGNGIPEIGETISYSFSITNTGNTSLFDITLTDNLPGINLIGNIIPILLPNETDNTSYSATYSITQNDLVNGFVSNQASVSGLTIDDQIVSDLSDFESLNNDNPTVVTFENDEIEIYTLVTPNGDGDNDYFIIGGIERFPYNTVEIYNRWGIKVYDTNGYGQNGNFFRGVSEGRVTVQQSSELPVGTYFYILKYVNNQGQTREHSGYLYINR